MAIIETLKPLTKILKTEYSINEQDRTKFSIPLNYIANKNTEFDNILPNVTLIDEASKQCYNQCMELHARVNKANIQYKNLNAAITNLKKCLGGMGQLTRDTERAWESLHRVEEKLRDTPDFIAEPDQTATAPTSETTETTTEQAK